MTELAPSSRSHIVAVVLAAGQGKRMRASGPKVLERACGVPIVRFPLDALDGAGIARKVVVVGVGREAVVKELTGRPGVEFAVQEEQRGTAHATACAKERVLAALAGLDGTVVVLTGDSPLIRSETITALLDVHARSEADATILTGTLDDPTGYGRIVRDREGMVRRIVEEKDATADERAIREVNTGTYAFRAEALFGAIADVRPDNAQSEYYLTDVIGILVGRRHGRVAAHRVADATETHGVNRRADLARAAAVLERRILERHMDRGVEIVAPHLTWIEADVEIGERTVIEPFTTIRRGAKIGAGCHVGPYAHLAEGTVLEDGAEIGNFVEVKRTRVREKAKAKHLAYLGDGDVGPHANIGAGTIFANYDGKAKHPTVVGEGAFIGSGTVIVAPAEVGPRAVLGAGAVLAKKKIPAGETWTGVPAKPHAKRTATTGGGGS